MLLLPSLLEVVFDEEQLLLWMGEKVEGNFSIDGKEEFWTL
jgi:hypothetical protein